MNTGKYFQPFRKNIIGVDQIYNTPYGDKRMVYADWIASGRLYRPIEKRISEVIGPFVGNTHTENSETGRLMTRTYHLSHERIKKHVHAGPDDVILTTGFGMTGAIVKFQRILGLKTCTLLSGAECLKEKERPVVFLTHMEHHSNQTSWYETVADVEVIRPGKDLLVDLNHLESALRKHRKRKRKIGSFTACSNVTGIRTPVHAMAKLVHQYNGLVFIDYAASAPYDEIDMHPADPAEALDAVFFSPHKFLGGPGASGVLIFNSRLYDSKVPDQPGGGTVDWTNPWGEYKFVDDIEIREDGGTPGFLQSIRAALAIELKEKMGVAMMHRQEDVLLSLVFEKLSRIPGLHILADTISNRLGVISFYIDGIHYNLAVSILSDRFGIQVRGGCACAGTYGHYLLDVSYEKSREITRKISSGDLSDKPGWIRLSLHPTMSVEEAEYICDAIRQVARNHRKWGIDYQYNKHTNEFSLLRNNAGTPDPESWLKL